jgi:hypothetical protein
MVIQDPFDGLIADDWRMVPNYPMWMVSRFGQVRTRFSPRGILTGQWRDVVTKPNQSDGRHYVLVRNENGLKKNARYRLVLLAFVGEPLSGQVACHNNGDCTDDRLENLRWDYIVENMRDRDAHGTTCRGSKKPNANLDEGEVLEICRRLAAGETQSKLAKEFGTPQANISAIVTGKIWNHLRPQIEEILKDWDRFAANRRRYESIRAAKPPKSKRDKLTPEIKQQVREMLASGKLQREVAAHFGMTQGAISRFVARDMPIES